MNTHDIELPPLPKPAILGTSRSGDLFRGYVAMHMQNYARAAIEADRQRRGEPIYAAPIAPQPALDAADLAFIADELRQAGRNRAADLVLKAMAHQTQTAEPSRGEPVAWPKNPQEIRDFIDVHFISMTGDDAPREDDKYLVTAHDLLSAFSWWTDFSPQRNRIDESMKAGARLTKHRFRLDAPQPTEPVNVPNDDQWQTLIGWLDRRRHYPTVQITGEVAGDLADLLARYVPK